MHKVFFDSFLQSQLLSSIASNLTLESIDFVMEAVRLKGIEHLHKIGHLCKNISRRMILNAYQFNPAVLLSVCLADRLDSTASSKTQDFVSSR